VSCARFLLARAIQFFALGVPQVYCVGLLAGANDMALLTKSGVGRDINRHYYTPEEIDQALQRPVVQSLFELIRFRNRHPAFDGTFSMPETRDSEIIMRWDNGVDWAMLEVDFASGLYSISNSPFELLGACIAGQLRYVLRILGRHGFCPDTTRAGMPLPYASSTSLYQLWNNHILTRKIYREKL